MNKGSIMEGLLNVELFSPMYTKSERLQQYNSFVKNY